MQKAKGPRMVNIGPYLPGLIDYLQSQDDILGAYLSGTYGTPSQSLDDIALALLFYDDTEPDEARASEIVAQVRRICSEDGVNVIVLNDADLTALYPEIEAYRALFEKDASGALAFRRRARSEYLDFLEYMEVSLVRDRRRWQSDPNWLTDQIAFVRENVERLSKSALLPPEELAGDEYRVIKNLLHESIQTLIDVGEYSLVTERLGPYRSSTDIFAILARNSLIPAELLSPARTMIRFRNRIVHDFRKVRPREVHTFLNTMLDNFEVMMRALTLKYLPPVRRDQTR